MPGSGVEFACTGGFDSGFPAWRGIVAASGFAEGPFEVAGRTSAVGFACSPLLAPFEGPKEGWPAVKGFGAGAAADEMPLGAGRV